MMGMPLRLFYTANIRGDLDLLPRLHTFIRRLRALTPDEPDDVALCAFQPNSERVLLIDLGHSCAPDIWHCAATGGRSVLLALDAMGFAAASVEGLLDDAARQRLHDNLLGLALVDSAHPHVQDELRFVFTPDHDESGIVFTPSDPIHTMASVQPLRLTIVLAPAATTRLVDRALHLATVEAGQLGMARLEWRGDQPFLATCQILDLPAAVLPDPTIAATVEFIRSEARLYQSRRTSN